MRLPDSSVASVPPTSTPTAGSTSSAARPGEVLGDMGVVRRCDSSHNRQRGYCFIDIERLDTPLAKPLHDIFFAVKHCRLRPGARPSPGMRVTFMVVVPPTGKPFATEIRPHASSSSALSF